MNQLYIIAGPNGAGKTTASFSILPGILGINEFVNAIKLNFVGEDFAFNKPVIYNPITWNKLNTQWKKHKNIRN